ncbi:MULTISPECIES: S24 family peptidase [unclassified Streptomyces]|uniref:LexA family protein n=1 Tax=unclassified Streptomyces TaxID=2593676 RepID=UPI0033F4F3CE
MAVAAVNLDCWPALPDPSFHDPGRYRGPGTLALESFGFAPFLGRDPPPCALQIAELHPLQEPQQGKTVGRSLFVHAFDSRCVPCQGERAQIQLGSAAKIKKPEGITISDPGMPPPTGPQPLTDRQRSILLFLQLCMRRGDPPSMREIAEAIGLASTSTVAHHLKAMEARGLVRRAGTGAQRSRTYIPADWPPADATAAAGEPDVQRIPLLSQLPRTRTEPLSQAETVLPLPAALLDPGGELFAVRMDGPAMTGAGIRHGDILTVHRHSPTAHGDTVAALVAGDTLIRQLQITRGGHVRLIAHNPGFPPVHGATAAVIGRVVAVLRSL